MESDSVHEGHSLTSDDEVIVNIPDGVTNETANKFLNELYNKKLDLKNKFSCQEINDIRTAVQQQVSLLATTIGDIDSRLKIQEVIPVGSAAEDTQIIRPCEFDSILILEALSQPGAVSLTPAHPSDKNRTYMYVKLAGENTRSLFKELSENDYYLKATHWLPCLRQGLRDSFYSAINNAVMLNSITPIKTNTGQLSIRHLKPEPHGPATMVRFVWERYVDNNATMEVSVDICPALKLDPTAHDNVLLSFDRLIFTELGYIESEGTVLLMPHVGHQFKVTFTKAEQACTANLHVHHTKCYTLLKYLVNGDPQPPERPVNCVMKHFQGAQTIFHSYALKTKIWKHHFKQHCTEENDIYGCIKYVLGDLMKHTTETLDHPFVNTGIRYVQESERYRKMKLKIPTKEHISIARLAALSRGLQKINTTPVEQYNYEDACQLIENENCPAKCLTNILGKSLSLCLLLLGVVLFCWSISFHYEGKFIPIVGTVVFICSTTCVLFAPGILHMRRYVIALRSFDIVRVLFCLFLCLGLFFVCIVLFALLITQLVLLSTDLHGPTWPFFLFNFVIFIQLFRIVYATRFYKDDVCGSSEIFVGILFFFLVLIPLLPKFF